MSPEQTLGQPVDARADVYSLGVVMYELATGKLPFSGEGPIAVMRAHLNEKPTPPSRHVPSIAPAYEEVILRCLAKEASQRWQSMAELGRAIVATLEGAAKRIEADVLLPFFGLSMSLGPIADWGLALERNQIEVDPATAATNKAGIFAVGDVVTYPGKLKLILTGFAEAAIAARSAYALIHPETPLHFEYSTTSGVPDA